MTSVILTVFDMAADTSPPRAGGGLGGGQQTAEGAAGSGSTSGCSSAEREHSQNITGYFAQQSFELNTNVSMVKCYSKMVNSVNIAARRQRQADV